MFRVNNGATLPVVEKVITESQIVEYTQASGDHNPLHLDPEFASKTQFGGIIAHGMLTLAFISEMLTRAFERNWLESGSLKVRLKGPAYPGDHVRTVGKVVNVETVPGGYKFECEVGLLNGHNEEIISGTAYLVRSDSGDGEPR